MLSVKRQTLIAGLVGGLCLFLVLGSTRSGHTELISTPARARQMMLRGIEPFDPPSPLPLADLSRLAPQHVSTMSCCVFHANGQPPRRQAVAFLLTLFVAGLGSGPEEESGQDWEVAMALDKGCERQQRERKEGNLAWGRYAGAEPCIPAKRSNPMMWPFDVPGKTWARGEDGSYASDSEGAEQRGKEEWPYNHADLHRCPPRPFLERVSLLAVSPMSPPSFPPHTSVQNTRTHTHAHSHTHTHLNPTPLTPHPPDPRGPPPGTWRAPKRRCRPSTFLMVSSTGTLHNKMRNLRQPQPALRLLDCTHCTASLAARSRSNTGGRRA